MFPDPMSSARATDTIGAGAPMSPEVPSPSMTERYGVVLVPINDGSRSAGDIVAQRQRDGWQLVSTRVDSEGAEIVVFRRPAVG